MGGLPSASLPCALRTASRAVALSSINAVMFYCGRVLRSVFPPATANEVAVGIQVMQLIITIVSAPFMDKFGRVPILLFAAVGQCIACILLGVYYLTIQCPQASSHGTHSGSGLLADGVFSNSESFLSSLFSSEPAHGAPWPVLCCCSCGA